MINSFWKFFAIPFTIFLDLKNIKDLIEAKIEKKLKKWNKCYLSLARRNEAFQKILSSYNIYSTSSSMLNHY